MDENFKLYNKEFEFNLCAPVYNIARVTPEEFLSEATLIIFSKLSFLFIY